MNKAFLIFSGYNQRAVVAFCRTLTRMHIPFYIVASGEQDFIFRTKYKKQVGAVRRTKELLWSDVEHCIERLKESTGHKEFVLCPSSEYLNQYVLENRDRFSKAHITVPLVDKDIYRIITNKEAFATYCSSKGLAIPRRITSFAQAEIPFVAKPIINIQHGRTLYPYLITDRIMYDRFLNQEKIHDFYFEEYLEGGQSYYLLYYISGFGYDVRFSQKNILQQAEGKSIVLARPAEIHRQEIGERYSRILQEAGFHGLIMIELKEKEGKFVMIEANPRLWGPSQLFVDNRMPLFDAFIFEAIHHKKYEQKAVQSTGEYPYLWLGGIVQNIFHGKKLIWHVYHRWHNLLELVRALWRDVYLRKDTLAYFVHELRISLTMRSV